MLVPEITLEGWTTSLPAEFSANDIISLYAGHGTHEQFHSEFKTDLDLTRLPSGKFDTNCGLKPPERASPGRRLTCEKCRQPAPAQVAANTMKSRKTPSTWLHRSRKAKTTGSSCTLPL